MCSSDFIKYKIYNEDLKVLSSKKFNTEEEAFNVANGLHNHTVIPVDTRINLSLQDKISILIEFLHTRDIYDKFILAMTGSTKGSRVYKTLAELVLISFTSVFSDAFLWEDTDDGVNYWGNLQKEWLTEISQYIN